MKGRKRHRKKALKKMREAMAAVSLSADAVVIAWDETTRQIRRVVGIRTSR